MAKVNLDIKCITGELNIRKGDSTAHGTTGQTLKQGQVVKVVERSDATGWYKLADGRGWVSGGASFVKVVSNNDTSKTPTKTDPKAQDVIQTQQQVATSVLSQGLDKKVLEMLYSKASVGNGKNPIDASTRLFGGPHQFIKETDFRLTKGPFQLGRKYLQSIVSEAPIVYFMPGRPNYLPELDNETTSRFTDFIINQKGADAVADDVLKKISNNKDTRYYSFISDYATYMRYVNLLCRFCAIYIGIGDRPAPGTTTPYKNYHWGNYRYEASFKESNVDSDNNSLRDLFNLKIPNMNVYDTLFGNYQYTQFYADPSLSFNETSNNNTSQSRVEGFFETAEGVAKELGFLLDAGAISDNAEALQNFSGSIDALKNQIKGDDNFLKRLLGSTSNVISGANMIFPQIWGDSNYNKSYNITINLVSPYGDKESIYLNCIVPLMHILALSMPRQKTANSYASPFLVRVFSKGWFSCEMGIIDNLTIEKGGQGAWTVEGLPSEIRVSIGVRDMYSSLMVTPSSSPDLFLQNAGLIDFLAVTCGVDISRPQFKLLLDAVMATLTNTVTDIPRNVYDDITQSLKNAVAPLISLRR